MIILEVLQVVIGMLVALFLPGYLIVRIFFEEFKILEKLVFSVGFSIMADIAIAIFFGYDEAQALRTGGLNFTNIVIAESILLTILLIMFWIKLYMKKKGITFIKKSKLTEKSMTAKEKKPVKSSKKESKSLFTKFKDNKGLYLFTIRTLIFSGVLIGLYLFVFLYFRHTDFFLRYLRLGDDFYLPFLTGLRKTDFLNAALFTAVIFILWNRDTIAKLKPYVQDKKQTILFGILAALTQIGHYVFKFIIRVNYAAATDNSLLLTLLKYAFNAAFIVFLALAVYNSAIFKDQFHKFKKQIPVFAVILAGYFFIIQMFQKIWLVLGNFVARSEYFLLSLTFKDTYLSMGQATGPRLGVGSFIVGISDACSGIDSLLLFLSLYGVLLALDWNKLNRKRMFILLIPGIIGTVLYNILRVYLLMLVGIFISPEFAVDMFHTNIGWLLFLLFFVVFWSLGSKWVYLPKNK